MPCSPRIRLALLGFTLSVLTVPAYAQLPPAPLSYQGIITDGAGLPVNGTVTLTFRLYDASATAVWAERHTGVVLQDGLYNLALGTGTLLSGFPPLEQFAFNQRYELSVQVNAEPEMTPRTPLWSVPFAHSLRGLRVLPVTNANQAPNLVGGHETNAVGSNVEGATISGGGQNPGANEVTGDYGTVAGGYGNAAGQHAVVSGGNTNTASAYTATIGGGQSNMASAAQATIGGGQGNTASAQLATISGGLNNKAESDNATVAGGVSNSATNGSSPTVGGGDNNTASFSWATVGGGTGNSATNQATTVGGGLQNTASGSRSTIAGGSNNTTNGSFSMVPGGYLNAAAGSYSFAAGRRAKANHSGTFVWGDGTDADFASGNANQFLIRAGGGVGIGTNSPQASLHVETNDVQLFSTSLLNDDVIIEDSDAVLGLYSSSGGGWGSAIVLGEQGGFGLTDKWAIARQTTLGQGNSHLYFTFGSNSNYASNTPLMRFDPDGDIHAAGTVSGGGVDLAEAFDVVGHTTNYEPGDVLVISTSHMRTVEKSSAPYSTLVAGVYAIKPGVLLHEGPIDEMLVDKVPMGIVGVIPTKVTDENGSIQIGDLLVTSSTPGHAMKADPEKLGFGMVLGKALEAYEGPHPGLIYILVNVK